MKNNKELSVVADVDNFDTHLTAYEKKTNEEDDFVKISDKKIRENCRVSRNVVNRCQKYRQKHEDNIDTNI